MRALDLSTYGMRVFLVAELDPEKAITRPYSHVIVTGQVDRHGEQLEALGFSRDPKRGFYVIAGSKLTIPVVRQQFPYLRVTEMAEEDYVVRPTRPQPPEPTAPTTTTAQVEQELEPPAPATPAEIQTIPTDARVFDRASLAALQAAARTTPADSDAALQRFLRANLDAAQSLRFDLADNLVGYLSKDLDTPGYRITRFSNGQPQDHTVYATAQQALAHAGLVAILPPGPGTGFEPDAALLDSLVTDLLDTAYRHAIAYRGADDQETRTELEFQLGKVLAKRIADPAQQQQVALALYDRYFTDPAFAQGLRDTLTQLTQQRLTPPAAAPTPTPVEPTEVAADNTTTTPVDDGRTTPSMDVPAAQRAGVQAFRDGRPAAPALNPSFRDQAFRAAQSPGGIIPLLDAYSHGWHIANLADAADDPTMPSVLELARILGTAAPAVPAADIEQAQAPTPEPAPAPAAEEQTPEAQPDGSVRRRTAQPAITPESGPEPRAAPTRDHVPEAHDTAAAAAESSTAPLADADPAALDVPTFFVPSTEPSFGHSPRQQLVANLRAIEIALRERQEPHEILTAADRDALARYSGWGGLPDVFDEKKYQYSEERRQLLSLVGAEAFEQLRASTLNAHFTPHALTRAMWDAVTRMGFDGGRVLEPGCGTGSFIGTMPVELRGRTQSTGVEREPVSATIAKLLYAGTNARIIAAPYERASIANESMDLAIGNIPFGGYQVFDAAFRNEGLLIHDYFLLKSLTKLRPGALMTVISSIGTLDKVSDAIRQRIADQADLVAAVRLPVESQRDSANCTVSTDLLIFRKRIAGEAPGPQDWLSTQVVTLDALKGAGNQLIDAQQTPFSTQSGTTTVRVNTIFAPGGRGRVIGQWTVNNRFGDARAMVAFHGSGEVLAQAFAQIPTVVPEKVYLAPAEAQHRAFEAASKSAETIEVRAFARDQLGHYVIRQGQLGQLLPAAATTDDHETIGDAARQGVELVRAVFQPLPADAAAAGRIRLMIPLRDALLDSLALQQSGGNDQDLAQLQQRALAAYQAFVQAFGPVNLPKNLTALRDDPDASLVAAAEVYDDKTRTGRPADVFRIRTLGPLPKDDASAPPLSPYDAMTASINRHGRVHPEWMAERAAMPWPEVRQALGQDLLLDPANLQWEPAFLLLAGDVREKLEVAEAALDDVPDEQRAEVERSIEALKAVVPAPIGLADIYVHPGAPWVNTRMIREFATEVLFANAARTPEVLVEYSKYTSAWSVGCTEKHAPRCEWDVSTLPALELLEAVLNSKPITITQEVEDFSGRRTSVIDTINTELARKRSGLLIDAFRDWLCLVPARQQLAENRYNAMFNGFVTPKMGAAMLSFPTLSTTQTLRDLQVRAIARALFGMDTLFAHPVGGGKTLMAIGLAIKLKEAGLGRKTLLCVRKNTVVQFERATRAFFPSARVLSIQLDDLNLKGRTRFFRRLQTHSPDLILVTPEALQRLKVPFDFEVSFIQREVGELRDALEEERAAAEASQSRGKRRKSLTIKAIEERVAKLEAKLQKMLTAKDDVRFTLADLGVDALVLDEAHYYKRLPITTRQQILGIPTSGSKRAQDLLMKVRFLQSERKRVVFMTGTPATNTLCEFYVMQTYLQPDLLKRAGISHFDAWTRTFAKVVSALEPDPGSGGYRMVQRLAEMNNVPELVRMFWQNTETVAEADLNLKRPTPKFFVHSVPTTPLQADYRQLLAVRTRIARMQARPEKGSDNILTILNDSRRASLDLRAVFPRLPAASGPGEKLQALSEEVHRIYARTRDTKATQLIFCDLATPGSAAEFNAYREIKSHLVRCGMPADAVAFIHDAKTDTDKDRIFERVRQGSVAVLLGSTEKMGEGTNVQHRLIALHHVTAPYHPGAVTQRNGRVIRVDNMHPECEIHTWVTKGLLEDWNWHLVLLKDNFIRQVMDVLGHRGAVNTLQRSVTEDVGAMGYGEIESAASGNPMVKEKYDLEAQVGSGERLVMALGMRQRSAKFEAEHLESRKRECLRELHDARAKVAQLDLAGFTQEACGTFTLDRVTWQPDVLKGTWAETAKALLDKAASGSALRDFRAQLGKVGPYNLSIEMLNGEGSARLYLTEHGLWTAAARGAANVGNKLAIFPLREDPKATTLKLRELLAGLHGEVDRLVRVTDRCAHDALAAERTMDSLTKELGREQKALAKAQARLAEVSEALSKVTVDPNTIDAQAQAFVKALETYGYSAGDILRPSTLAKLDWDGSEAYATEDDDDEDESPSSDFELAPR